MFFNLRCRIWFGGKCLYMSLRGDVTRENGTPVISRLWLNIIYIKLSILIEFKRNLIMIWIYHDIRKIIKFTFKKITCVCRCDVSVCSYNSHLKCQHVLKLDFISTDVLRQTQRWVNKTSHRNSAEEVKLILWL